MRPFSGVVQVILPSGASSTVLLPNRMEFSQRTGAKVLAFAAGTAEVRQAFAGLICGRFELKLSAAVMICAIAKIHREVIEIHRVITGSFPYFQKSFRV